MILMLQISNWGVIGCGWCFINRYLDGSSKEGRNGCKQTFTYGTIFELIRHDLCIILVKSQMNDLRVLVLAEFVVGIEAEVEAEAAVGIAVPIADWGD